MSEILIDVRQIAPRDRHPLIFGTFADLETGQALLLCNDHDPKPLHYQFLAEYAGQFDWQYLQEGPDEWRVRISRVKAA